MWKYVLNNYKSSALRGYDPLAHQEFNIKPDWLLYFRGASTDELMAIF
jgi:hypothetical protein